MPTPSQIEKIRKAEEFRRLHGQFLVLPNAWDAASARMIVDVGFPAVATSSGAVAEALGYADGEQTPPDEMIAAAERIAGSVHVPVTADMERGYGRRPEDVGGTILRLLVYAGAVGVNLEDSTGDPAAPLQDVGAQTERLQMVRQVAETAGIPLFINARVDVYLRGVGAESERLDHTLRRARAYLEAGADSIFVIGVRDREILRTLAAEIPAPLNVMLTAGSPSLSELRELGVRRVSLGSGLFRCALRAARRAVEELRDTGSSARLFDGG